MLHVTLLYRCMRFDIAELLQTRVLADITPVGVVLCNCIPAATVTNKMLGHFKGSTYLARLTNISLVQGTMDRLT